MSVSKARIIGKSFGVGIFTNGFCIKLLVRVARLVRIPFYLARGLKDSFATKRKGMKNSPTHAQHSELGSWQQGLSAYRFKAIVGLALDVSQHKGAWHIIHQTYGMPWFV